MGPPSLYSAAASIAAHRRLRDATRAEGGGPCWGLDAALGLGLGLASLDPLASCCAGPSLWWWCPPKKLEARDGPLRPAVAEAWWGVRVRIGVGIR